MTPTLGRIRRTNGVAGQFAYTVQARYSDEDAHPVQFVGSSYGGPVVMITDAFPQGVFVTDPGRFGTFSPAWVRRFFGKES